MRKIVFLWMVLITVSLHTFADGKVSFTASAPDAGAAGELVRPTVIYSDYAEGERLSGSFYKRI